MASSSEVAMTATAAVIINNTENRHRTYRIRNDDAANAVMLGASTVTFAVGYLLAAGDSLELSLGQESIWGICDTALTATIQVLAHP